MTFEEYLILRAKAAFVIGRISEREYERAVDDAIHRRNPSDAQHEMWVQATLKEATDARVRP